MYTLVRVLLVGLLVLEMMVDYWYVGLGECDVLHGQRFCVRCSLGS